MQAHKRDPNAPVELNVLPMYMPTYTPILCLEIDPVTVSGTHCIPPHNVRRTLVYKPTMSPSLVASTAAVSEHVYKGGYICGHLYSYVGLYLVMCMIGLCQLAMLTILDAAFKQKEVETALRSQSRTQATTFGPIHQVS